MNARVLAKADVPAIAVTLARALADDPGWIHVFPDDATRVARMTRMLALVSKIVYAPEGASWTIDGHAGGALWERPGEHGVGTIATFRLFPRLLWLIGRRTRPALSLFGAMERKHPKEPHHYLAVLGIDPAHQGRGLGPKLIAPVLDAADAARLPCWLESTNPKNHSFYRRMGFEVADQTPPDELGSPTITFFLRRAR